jgi:hypothetical protein
VIASYKHSSLLGLAICNKEKKFYNMDNWSELLSVFDGIRCKAPKLGEVSAHPPQIIAGLPPAFLAVDGHQSCLGVQPAASGSHQEKCLPAEKPAECSDEAWNKLSQVFTGSACGNAAPSRTPIVTSVSLPPAYLNVPGVSIMKLVSLCH